MTPLEIGLHALRAVPKFQGKKGAGIAAYAEKIGRPRQNVSIYRNGAEVFEAIRTSHIDVRGLLDKAQHLSAIHAAPKQLWPGLVEGASAFCAMTRALCTVSWPTPVAAAIWASTWTGSLFPEVGKMSVRCPCRSRAFCFKISSPLSASSILTKGARLR